MKRKKSFIHIDWKIGLIFLVFSVCCRTVYAQTVSVELKSDSGGSIEEDECCHGV